MTVLLECKNISVEYGDSKILNNINLKVKNGEKIGIVGSNGAGKTTLANVIDGSIRYQGKVNWFKDNINIGYMKQATDYIDRDSHLSGGEKTKKLLQGVIYGNYDMLILDEPTNHLDFNGVNWLIRCIKKFKGTVLIISHDRYFLDESVNHIVEVENESLVNYNGNYTWYREKKKKDYEDILHKYKTQEELKAKINSQIAELKEWSGKAHRDSTKKALESGCKMGVKEFYRAKAKKKDIQIKSKIKRLEKIEVQGVEKPKEEEKVVFNIRKPQKTGSLIVRAEDISMSFGEKIIFEKASFYIKRNEKIGLFGVNGCGKTTLIKALLGSVSCEGNLYINNNCKIGYISQEVIDLNEENRILDEFAPRDRVERGEIITKLNLLGFSKEDLAKKIKVLSLGERMKLKILLMINKNCDVLILDEPTNHIDLHVREQLEEVLVKFNGTIILVTHDRYMLKKVCNKLLVFENKNIFRCEYGIEEYLNKDKKERGMEDKLIIENKISYILSELSFCQVGSEKYLELDKKYNELLKLRNQ